MKRKISVLVILMLAMAIMAPSAQVLTETITFDGLTEESAVPSPLAVTERGGTVKIADTQDGGTALKISGGTTESDNAFAQIAFKDYPTQKVTVKFKVKKGDTTTSVGLPTIRTSDAAFYAPLTFNGSGMIMADNGKTYAADYNTSDWYEITVSMDIQNGYMGYEVKSGSEIYSGENIEMPEKVKDIQAVRFHVTGAGEPYIYADDIGIEQEESFALTSGTVENGAANAGINPQLEYLFNREIDGCSLENIGINGDTSYIKSASAEGNKLTVKLAKTLNYDTKYTLNLKGIADVNGNLYGKNIEFTTKYGYNITEDDFETGAYDTTKWRPMVAQGGAEMAVVNAPKPENSENMALHINGKTHTDTNYQAMLQTPLNFKQIPGDTVIEYSFMRPDADADMTILELRDCTASGSAYATNAGLMKLGADRKIYFKDKTEGYVCVGEYAEAGEEGIWVKAAMHINPSKSTYKLYINGEEKTVNGRDFEFAQPLCTTVCRW